VSPTSQGAEQQLLINSVCRMGQWRTPAYRLLAGTRKGATTAVAFRFFGDLFVRPGLFIE
jgi:hypothetical protein